MNHGILKVTEYSRKMVDAIGAKLHISILGENFVFGNAAIEKCHDVKIAVNSIKLVDPSINVVFEGVTVKSDTGWFAKGSKGVYSLTFYLADLAKINEVLGSIMELKNVNLESLEWDYDEHTAKMALVEEAVKRCKSKADLMASALGKTIIGVKYLADSYEVAKDDALNIFGGDLSEPRALHSLRPSRSISGDFGTEVKGKKEIFAVATTEFFLENLPNTIGV